MAEPEKTRSRRLADDRGDAAGTDGEERFASRGEANRLLPEASADSSQFFSIAFATREPRSVSTWRQ